MKQLFYILVLLLALASCRSVKETSVSEHSKSDSSTVKDTSSHVSSRNSETVKEIKDSAITVPERVTDSTFKPDDLTPAYDGKGKAIDRQYHFNSKGVRGKVTVKADSSVQVECLCDSLQFIVSNLIREQKHSSEVAAYWQHQYKELKQKESLVSSKTKVVEKKTFWGWVSEHAAIIVLLWLVVRWLFNTGKNILSRYRKFYG